MHDAINTEYTYKSETFWKDEMKIESELGVFGALVANSA